MDLIVALIHAASTLFLTGVVWVVQTVVYPAFESVPPAGWADYHAAHRRRITAVLALPWPAQVVSLMVLLFVAPGSPIWLRAVDAVLVALPILITLRAVHVHSLLDADFSPGGVRHLIRLNFARGLAWTGGSVSSLAFVAYT